MWSFLLASISTIPLIIAVSILFFSRAPLTIALSLLLLMLTFWKLKIILDEWKDKIRIRIVDNGEGIEKERLARVGEPYYTSKEKGTGIGLTVCYKLVKEHNGEMTVKSKEKWGTVVTLLFPKIKG